MGLNYGFVKSKVVSTPTFKASRCGRETQYHIHTSLRVPTCGRPQAEATAVNVGTKDADGLLDERLVFNHSLVRTVAAAAPGSHDVHLNQGSGGRAGRRRPEERDRRTFAGTH